MTSPQAGITESVRWNSKNWRVGWAGQTSQSQCSLRYQPIRCHSEGQAQPSWTETSELPDIPNADTANPSNQSEDRNRNTNIVNANNSILTIYRDKWTRQTKTRWWWRWQASWGEQTDKFPYIHSTKSKFLFIQVIDLILQQSILLEPIVRRVGGAPTQPYTGTSTSVYTGVCFCSREQRRILWTGFS